MTRRDRIVVVLLSIFLALMMIGAAVAGASESANSNGQDIFFDGRVIHLSAAKASTVQSYYEVTDYGDVTVTISAVTVTMWTK
jgi:hypothetical protein